MWSLGMGSYHDLDQLTPSWRRSLRASNRSPRTIDSYVLATGQLTDWLTEHGRATDVREITADDLRGYLAHVLETRASATARQRYASLRQCFKWLTEEGEIESDPMQRVTPPKVTQQPPPVLRIEELRALIAACEGKSLADRRDEAIIRLFVDTGIRLGELAGLKLEDVDLDLGVAVVLGKGRRFRSVPFGHSTTKALDRYLRARRTHPHASEPWLWLGLKGRLSPSGIEQVVARRSRAASLGRINPHAFRHSFAHAWLAAGGNEGDLQRLAGWSSPQMLARYGASAADERARDAHKRFGLGDSL
jgi:site-specific recombinase XerD